MYNYKNCTSNPKQENDAYYGSFHFAGNTYFVKENSLEEYENAFQREVNNAIKEVKDSCVKWIRDFFNENGHDCNAVIGISGGKDSTVVTGLCVEALGKDRVIGVLMPNGVQSDIEDAKAVVNHLNIKHYVINIQEAYKAILNALNAAEIDPSEQTLINLAPRLRMAALYSVSQSHNGRVANTCNLSEDWIGYATRYGDAAGDFSPLCQLTVGEVVAIGDLMGMPSFLTHKTPSDGLCGKTDEDKIGFTYATLDKYIRFGECDDEKIKAKIDRMHDTNLFKIQLMPGFNPGK